MMKCSTSNHTTCYFQVTSPHGQILSPNYPEDYPAKKDCIWHFSTTPGHRIRLMFNAFDVEPHPVRNTCASKVIIVILCTFY